MLISSERHAAQVVSQSEETRFFDDLGCLATSGLRIAADAKAFVHAEDAGWIDAELAVYAAAHGVRTPMGYDVAAFARPPAALPASAVRTWTTLQETLEAHR
jgi:hypothetical protein